jgi:hypothetical protein
MSSAKRQLGIEGDRVFQAIRDELASLLDNCIENQEKVPSPDLWLDFSSGLLLSVKTIIEQADEMHSLGIRAEEVLMREVYESLPKH